MVSLSILALAFAVSIDGFAAGLAYGIKRIKITLGSLILISLTSALAIWLSMFLGSLLMTLITPNLAEILGGVILISLGFWLMVQNININTGLAGDYNEELKLQELKDIISEPLKADIDGSGVISGKEAIILGVALAMDAMAAGFGASLMGFHSYLTPIFVGICKLLLIPCGIKLGKHLSLLVNSKFIVFLPGIILILLGLINLII